MLNIEQPINYCGFCGDSPNIFAASTIETISLVNLESASVAYQINPIQNVMLSAKINVIIGLI